MGATQDFVGADACLCRRFQLCATSGVGSAKEDDCFDSYVSLAVLAVVKLAVYLSDYDLQLQLASSGDIQT
jgi:hypothetical protein